MCRNVCGWDVHTHKRIVLKTVKSTKYLATAEFFPICTKTEKSNSILPYWNTFDYRISKLISSHIAQQMPHWMVAAALPWCPKWLSLTREAFLHSKPGVLCKILSTCGSVWFWGPVSYADPLKELRSQFLRTVCNWIWLSNSKHRKGRRLLYSLLQRLAKVKISEASLAWLFRSNCQ